MTCQSALETEPGSNLVQFCHDLHYLSSFLDAYNYV